MRIIVFIIFSILLIAPVGAQSLEEELIQIYQSLGISIVNIENGLQNIESGQKESDKALQESEAALNESEKEAAIYEQRLNSSEQLGINLEKSFSDYREKTEKSLSWSKFWNRVLIMAVIAETVVLLLRK